MTIDKLVKVGHAALLDAHGKAAEEAVRVAIARYGVEAVKAAVQRLTKPKLGRKPVKDWPELRQFIEADARAFLAGGDPFTARTNYSIAKAFADQNPGHSHPGTMKRIMRKLDERRVWTTLVVAENMSRQDYPLSDHFRVLQALCRLEPEKSWQIWHSEAEALVRKYEHMFGSKPAHELSLKQVDEAVLSKQEPFALGVTSPIADALRAAGYRI